MVSMNQIDLSYQDKNNLNHSVPLSKKKRRIDVMGDLPSVFVDSFCFLLDR